MLSKRENFIGSYSSTDNFLVVPVSDWVCCVNLILYFIKKEMKMIKIQILWWKPRKKAKKVYENINYYKHKLYLYSELAPMTLDVTHSKR